MKWVLFASCVHLALLAKGDDLPKELRALEFGFNVESVEADTPLLELQWKYREHLLKLRDQFAVAKSTKALAALGTELDSLAEPLRTPLSPVPDLRRLQEAHRTHFSTLLSSRDEVLRPVIQHYVSECETLAETWKSAGRQKEAALALTMAAKFAAHADQPIPYREFLEKRIAESEEPPSGPLRAWGVVAQRAPIDIRTAGRYNDFVAVEFHNRYWAAIRRNGDVVSSQPKLNGLQNVAQIEMNDRRAYVLFRHGEVGSVPPDKDIPPNLRGVKKISVSHRDVLALTESGRITGWGESFGTPGFRPTETWVDIQDIAMTWGSGELQGFALHSDGTVSTWGGGDKPIRIPNDLPEIATLDAGWTKLACLTKDGRAIVIDHRGYSRHGLPPDSVKLVSLLIRGPLVAAQTEEGRWLAWGNSSMGVSDQIKQLENTQTITYKLNASEKGWGALLWIHQE